MSFLGIFLEEVNDVSDSVATESSTQTTLTPWEKIFDFDFGWPTQVQVLFNKAIEVLAVIIVLIILCKIVDLITRGIRRRMLKKKADKTIVSVVYQLLNKGLKIILVFMAIGVLGVDTTSIVGLSPQQV